MPRVFFYSIFLFGSILIASCGKEETKLLQINNAIMPSEDSTCALDSSSIPVTRGTMYIGAKRNFISNGNPALFGDIGFGYNIGLRLTNSMMPVSNDNDDSSSGTSHKASDIFITNYQVTLTPFRGSDLRETTSLSAQPAVVEQDLARYDVTLNWTIPAQTEAYLPVTLIPDLGQNQSGTPLSEFYFNTEDNTKLDFAGVNASIKIFGKTLAGKSVESNVFTFPIDFSNASVCQAGNFDDSKLVCRAFMDKAPVCKSN